MKQIVLEAAYPITLGKSEKAGEKAQSVIVHPKGGEMRYTALTFLRTTASLKSTCMRSYVKTDHVVVFIPDSWYQDQSGACV